MKSNIDQRRNQYAMEFWRIKKVCEVTSLSRATIYRLMKKEKDPFPRQVACGSNSRAWIRQEVTEWMRPRPRVS